MTGLFPGRSVAITSDALIKFSRPRPAAWRERPNSAHEPRASSNRADRSQPAVSQQAVATWREGPESRSAGSHQAHGIGPNSGGRVGPVAGSGSARTVAEGWQPGSRATESNPASSAAWRPRCVDRPERHSHSEMLSTLHRFRRPNRHQRNRTGVATWSPEPGSRAAVAIQIQGIGPLRKSSPCR
jgi:hypothetical protein